MAKVTREELESHFQDSISSDHAGRTSKGTPWEDYLDELLHLLKDDEEVKLIYGYLNTSLPFNPATMLTITTDRIIYQNVMSKLNLLRNKHETLCFKLEDIESLGIERLFLGLTWQLKLIINIDDKYGGELTIQPNNKNDTLILAGCIDSTAKEEKNHDIESM